MLFGLMLVFARRIGGEEIGGAWLLRRAMRRTGNWVDGSLADLVEETIRPSPLLPIG
jgi:hypothetical protein